MRTIIFALVSFLYFISSCAMAITPASPEQMLCSNELILVGTVISEAPIKCIETNSQRNNCSENKPEEILLEIAVTKVISHQAKSENYKFLSVAMPKHMIPLPIETMKARLEEYFKDKRPKSFSDSTYRPGDVNEFLVGREFIFGFINTQHEPKLLARTLHQSSSELEVLEILKSSKINGCIKVD